MLQGEGGNNVDKAVTSVNVAPTLDMGHCNDQVSLSHRIHFKTRGKDTLNIFRRVSK